MAWAEGAGDEPGRMDPHGLHAFWTAGEFLSMFTGSAGTALPFAVITSSGKFGTPWSRMQETNFCSCELEEPAAAAAGAEVVVEPMWATLAEDPPATAGGEEGGETEDDGRDGERQRWFPIRHWSCSVVWRGWSASASEAGASKRASGPHPCACGFLCKFGLGYPSPMARAAFRAKRNGRTPGGDGRFSGDTAQVHSDSAESPWP